MTRSKKFFALMVAAALALPALAFAQEEFEGYVTAGDAIVLTAPYGGTVKRVSVREGELIAAGDATLLMNTAQTAAPVDGTVRGVFAAQGDLLANTTVLNVAPLSKYTVACTIGDAYDSIDTRFVRLGETVYLRCRKDGTHQAQGTVTAVNGSNFTVQTTAGELYMEETVYVYRSDTYAAKTRIGSGTVGRTPEIAVTGTGGLLSLAVAEGEPVERGQLLFETVEGSLDAGTAQSATVYTDVSGVVASVKVAAGQKVSKGDALMTLYQPAQYVIAFAIDEDLLDSVAVGDPVTLSFHWNEDAGTPINGTVTGISYVSATDAAEAASTSTASAAQYTGYASFAAGADVRLGMSVTVTTVDE